MEVEREKLKIQELIDDVKFACRKGAYQNSLSLRSLACCFLRETDPQRIRNVDIDHRLRSLIKQHSPQQEKEAVPSPPAVPNELPETDAPPLSPTAVSEPPPQASVEPAVAVPSTITDLTEPLAVLKEFEPVLFHAISGYLRQKHDRAESVCLELLVLLKVALLSEEGASRFEPNFQAILDATDAGRKYIDLVHLKAVAEYDAALDAQPVSTHRWVSLHGPSTNGAFTIDGATISTDLSNPPLECTTIAAIGWRQHVQGTRSYSLHAPEPISGHAPFRVGWICLQASPLPGVLLGDDAGSIGFDGTSVFYDYERIATLDTPVATWADVSCSLNVDTNTLTFEVVSHASVHVSLPLLLHGKPLVPAVGIGHRSFRSTLMTRFSGMYPNVFTGLGYLCPVPLSAAPTDAHAPVELIGDCTEFSSGEGAMCRPHPSIQLSPKAWTVSFFVHPLATQDNSEPRPWRTIFLKGQDQSMERTASVFLSCDRLLLAVCVSTKSDWNSTLVSSGPLTANQWTHIAVVCDGLTLRLIIQGKEDRTLSLNDAVVHNNHPFYFGKSPPGVKKATTDYKGFRGYLKHVLLYPTRACSVKEISKFVKERKNSVDATDLSSARQSVLRSLNGPPQTLVLSTRPAGGDNKTHDAAVTYYSTAAGGTVHVPALFQSVVKWPEEFHIQATVRMKPSASGAPMQILAACASSTGTFAFVWGVTTDGQLSVRTNDRKFTTTGRYIAPSSSSWTTLGWSYTLSQVVFFVDGHAVETMPSSNTHLDAATSSATDLYIGGVPFECSFADQWAGHVGGVKVFRDDPRTSQATIAHYSLSEGQGTVVYDLASGRHGRAQSDQGWRTEPSLKHTPRPMRPLQVIPSENIPLSARILRFLESMAVVYLKSIEVDSVDAKGTIESGAVWTHVLTFVLLHSLLRQVVAEEGRASQGQAIVALLRILRANFKPLSSFVSKDLSVPLGVPPASVGLGTSDSTSFSQRLNAFLSELAALDVEQIDEDSLKLMHHEAILVQVAGTEIFHATTQTRADQLIRALATPPQAEELCRYLLSQRHLVLQFLPFPDRNNHSGLFPWTVEHVQSALLDAKSLTTDDVIAVLERFQNAVSLRAMSPEQLVVVYETWHLYYRDNHCQLSAPSFKQLWKALVHHLPSVSSTQSSSLVDLVSMLQSHLLDNLLPQDKWDVATTSRLQQWHAPRRYFKVVNCPIGIRATPNVKAPKIGRTLNIGQVIESNHVLRKHDDAVLYVCYGDGWVFDVDPSDGMMLLEELVLGNVPVESATPYSLSKTMQDMVQAKETATTKGWLEFDAVGEGCKVDPANPTIATCQSDATWTGALSNKSIKQGSGVYTWRLQVNKCANVGQLVVGLATKPASLDNFCIGTSPGSYGWMLTGDFYSNGKRTKASTLPLFGSKSLPLLDITVNTTANTLVVRNADTGVQCGLPHVLELVAGEDYYPAVSLFRRDDSVSWQSPILFPSELSQTPAVPPVEPTPLTIYCAKQLLSVYRNVVHQDAAFAGSLQRMVAQVAAHMCLWTTLHDERDSITDLVEDILLHRNAAAMDDALTLGCLAGQLYGDMIYGAELEHFDGPEHKWVQSMLFHGGVSKRTDNPFLKHFIDGSCSNLDKTMLRFVGGSALVLRMGGPNLDRAIRGVVASMMFHCGMTMSAESLDVDSLKMPPKSLRLIWQKAVELKAWALRYKTSASTTYDDIAAMLTSKVELLLTLTPCKSGEYLGEPPSLSRRISMGSKRSGSFDATPEDAAFPDWETDLLQAIYGFYKDTDCSIVRIQEILSSSQQKAVTRVSGLRRATNVLNSTSVAIPVKAALLLHLIGVLRNKNAHLWHYQHGISGCPATTKHEAHLAFEGFYYCITQLLSNGCDDVSWQLVLLDASALRILPEDHVMLASCRVFQTLQEILDRTGDTPSLMGLRQATMKVVYLLALQVASEGEQDNHINSLNPPHFKRQLSGPQTLSANVFDILYSEMYVAVHSMLEVDASATYRVDTIGPNPSILGVLSLLQFVSTSAVCQNFLCTPNWLSLFLTTACFGQVEPQTRAMHLLHTLLPLCDPSFLGIDLAFDVTTLACVTTSCRAMPLLEFFLESVGIAMTPLDSSRTTLPRSVESCLSLGSESVSMLRMLLANETWTDLVAQCLSDSYQSKVPSKQLGVLAVMGSFPEPLRFGGQVELPDGGRATVVAVEMDKRTVDVQKAVDQSVTTLDVDGVIVVPRVSLSMAAFPLPLIDTILGETAQLVDSVFFLHHFQVARLIYNEDASRLAAFVAAHPAMALKVFEIGATLTDTNGLLSLPHLEDKFEIVRCAQYANSYGAIRDAMFPVSEAKADVVDAIIACHTTARLGFAEGLVCTMKQVSTFDVPVDIDPTAVSWMEGLLNHILSLAVAELVQAWAKASALSQIDLLQVQHAVEKIYGLIQLPEMLQAACAEANEWLSNRDHWGKEWALHEASIVQYVLAQLTLNKTAIPIEQWSDKCASLKAGSYLCATCECLVADVLSLAIEVLRNADAATPVITLASILEAMRGDEELGRLLAFHESFLALQTAQAPPPADKTSDEKVMDVRLQSMITMGFPENWCKRALDESGQDVNAALNWILMNGDLLQESTGAESPPQTPESETASTAPDAVAPQPEPSVQWSTATTVDVTGPYATFWKLEDGKAVEFTVQCRTGGLVGLFSSPTELKYEVGINDRSLQLRYDGAVVCSDSGAFCDDLTGVAYWVVCTPDTIAVGQGSVIDLSQSVLKWKRTDSSHLDCFSFGSSATSATYANISTVHSFSSASEPVSANDIVVTYAAQGGHDFSFCFYDGGLSSTHATGDQFNVWGAHGTRQGFQDAMAQETAAGLLQHSNHMARVLRILYARRLGLTILTICSNSLESIFRHHEQFFVEFVSLVSNRQWISDITVNQPLQWYLPRKPTSVDFLRPAIQTICASTNPLSTALCAYLESHMAAFLQNSNSLHWTEPSHLKTDLAVRQGADLRFLLLVTQWLLPVSNVMERALFGVWTASLKSAHVNVKQTALQVLSHLLDRSLNDGTTDALQEYTQLVSLSHLKRLTARLLKDEEENSPMYSQFFQAHVDFLALLDRALHRLDGAVRPTTPHFGLFFKGAASLIDINGEAVSPPWTAQYSVRPVAGGAVAVLANSNATSIQLRCGKLFDGKPSIAIKTKMNGKLYPLRCAVPDDKWSVLTITASLTAVSVYINGALASSVEIPRVYLPLAHIGDPTQGFRGWLANVRYFESELLPSQVKILADSDLALFTPDVEVPTTPFDSVVPALTAIGHWPLMEGGGAVVRDALQRYADVVAQGVAWTRVDRLAPSTTTLDSQLSSEYLEKHLVFSGTGTFAQQACGSLGGMWNQPSTKALAVRLYSVDRSHVEGVVELNTKVRCLVKGTAQSDGSIEFAIATRRGDADADSQWMDGVTFHGWHRKGTLKGTWSTSLTQTIPPRFESPMYFLPPTTDSVVLSDGGRLAMSVLRKNKKKASVVYLGFGSTAIQRTWASNGVPTSDLAVAAQHEILNQTDAFATVRCHTMVSSGKAYFEMTLKTGGLMQLGFACPGFKPAFSTHGVGDHFGSFAVDGKRHKKWCNTGTSYGGDWAWSAGDVVGAMVDFDNGTMAFAHQGRDLGVAFTQQDYPQVDWTSGLFAAGSFSSGEGALFNLGQVPFQHEPPPGYVSVLQAAASPAPGRVEVYSHRQKTFTPVSTSHRVTAQVACPFPTQSISYGVYLWEVAITSLMSTDGIRVGVCIEGVNATVLLGEDRFGWGLCSSGKVYHNNTSQRYASTGFAQGDRVGIELDMYKGTLGFYRNQHHLGDAFTNLNMELPMKAFIEVNQSGGFVPAVSLFRPQSAVVCVGLKEGRDSVEYLKKHQTFTGVWRQGQRDGDGKLHLHQKEGYYLGTWVDNELDGSALWCEPFPICVPTMYPDVWKRLRYQRAPDHTVCGTRRDVLRRGSVVEAGQPLPPDQVVTSAFSTASKGTALQPATSCWYASVQSCLRFVLSQPSNEPSTTPQPTTTSISIDGTWQSDAQQRFVLLPHSPSYDHISIASDLTSAKLEPHASSGNHVLFRGNVGMTCGVHYWEVGVQACNHGSLFIGIASSQITASEGWGDFGFVSYRVRWSQAEGEQLYGRYFSAGDTIGVRFDMEEGTLSFTKDGDDFTRGRPAVIHMGVAFRHLRSQNTSHNLTFVPVVGCSQPGDAFTVKGYKWHSQLKPRWPMARLERALDAAAVVLDAFPNAATVARATELYHSFKTVGEFQPKRYRSRGGILIELTTAMFDRAVARLNGNDRFSLRHGEALVLGEKDGVIWYIVEGEEAAGAWYWSDAEVAYLLTINPSEIVVEPWNCVACTMLNDGNLSKCQICDTPHETPVEETPDADDDGAAYEPMIALPPPTESDGSSGPTLPSIASLLNGWTPAVDLILVQQMDVLCDDRGQDPENVSWVEFWSRVQPLVEYSEDEVAARLSVLLAWNDSVAAVLPFVDFHGQALLEGPISRTATKLTQMRHLIFKRIKMAFWKDMLDITTTHTTPPSDEYERPESLREVSVNRILALNEPVSLGKSVFGQLYEAMQSWDNQSLRRAYADELQDAGQRRAFYVKFLGEGVDDHGGPYRAVFQTGGWDEPSASLKLFVPCPNAVTTGGMNQDKFVVNTAANRSHLTFLGKLIGMAARHRIMVPLNCSDLFWKPLVGLSNDRKDLSSVDTMLMRELHDLECLGDAEVEALDPEEVIEYLLRVTQAPRNPHMKRIDAFTCASLGRLIEETIAFKLDAVREQLHSFMEGMAAVVPYALFNLFTPTQFEELVCGSPHIDIEMLQRITVYEGVDASAPHIAFFWQCLHDMNQDQRSSFVNFVLARSRLPRSLEEFTLHFKIQPAIITGDDTNPDHYLPHSQTCFFSLSLPRYSSKDICMDKLLYAIHNSPTMDADFVERGSAGWEHTT